MRFKKVVKRIPLIIAIIVAIWLVGDFGYSRYVASKLNTWEQTVERNQDGVMVGCEAYSIGPETGESETAILLIHGINDTPFCWRKMAPELAKKYHVRAMRMPGFGEPIPVCAQKSSEDWISAVLAEATKLRAENERVFIVAHSLGGAVTIQALLREKGKQAELVDGVILLAPAIEVSNRRSPVFSTRFWHRVAGLLVFTKVTYNPFGNDAKDPNEQDAPNRVRFSPRNTVDETFKLIDQNRGHESAIKVPVLMVISEQDNVNDHEAAANWMKKISSERKETFWNNSSGHALQYDLGWQSVTEKIIEFIQP